ncbi:hypothetical protein H7J88_22860 [Mycolicibacterium flavescens]|uniref:Uncharacterized protein n=1 Tax=Mycolicibacterium flavescens TaxID=1776 RepID=A0A1E3RJT4_MYCFV|nr:hypothetical protein [Mycolicibacterium flavescens]MCV7282478.1 hypothetical protein [Mycolicibacterium flavescens]ODQ90114.1 hypothetical protein BHQ18_11775 [Mycolicibacterium flavescens]
MAQFLALQGSAHQTHQSAAYELQDGVDIEKLAQELSSAVTLDRVVPVPAVLPQNKGRRQKVTLYVRPAAWGLWTFYELSEEDQRQMLKENPLLNALIQGAAQQGQARPGGQQNPLFGQQ